MKIDKCKIGDYIKIIDGPTLKSAIVKIIKIYPEGITYYRYRYYCGGYDCGLSENEFILSSYDEFLIYNLEQ